MKEIKCILGGVLFLLILISCCLSQDTSGNQKNIDILYQYSTIEALLEGVNDGNMTFGELKKHGDYGLGTFNALDGEMIQVGGKFYQIKIDGVAYPVDDNERTPFAVVTFFDKDGSINISNASNFEELTKFIDANIPTKNIFYLIKIEGTFDYVKTRSVPRQEKPYPPLTKAVEKQKTFEFNNTKGTLIGFRFPDYVGNMNVPGYHFHFITEDRKAGGHVLELRLKNQEIQIDYTTELFMITPDNNDFYTFNSGKNREEEVKTVEKTK